MKKILMLLFSLMMIVSVVDAQRGRGGYRGGNRGGNRGGYNGYHYNRTCVITPHIYIAPRAYYHQSYRVWVEGYWTYDPYGQPYWVAGYWRWVY